MRRAATSELGDRSTYIGASDFATLVGVNPYSSPLDLYRRLTGEGTDDAGDAARIGLLLEPVIVAEYEYQTGTRTFRRNEFRHPVHEWIRVHPDRLVIGKPGLMDAKASAWAHGYGDPGTDAVPPSVRVQMVVLMGVTRREWADVALFRGTRGLDVYRVPADATLYHALIEEAVRFWDEHVGPRIPPPVDGSESYSRYLSERYPADDGTEMVATPEQALLIEGLAEAKADEKVAGERVKLAQQRIQEVMGEATGLVSPAGRVTWKQQTRAAHVVAESTFRAFRYIPPKAEEAA
jgi:predicted phage-related endonuclease